MTRLDLSVALAERQMIRDLTSDSVVEELLGETSARRRLDLSDLGAHAQAELLATRSVGVLPSIRMLQDGFEAARSQRRSLVVKLAVDPASTRDHLAQAVPLVLLSRFQRMGHHVVVVIDDTTGARTTGSEITDEGAGYRRQLAPWLDLAAAELRRNGEWLSARPLDELWATLSSIPVQSLLAGGEPAHRPGDPLGPGLAGSPGLTTAELLRPVVRAIDSWQVGADIEVGVAEQLADMRIGRQVSQDLAHTPPLVVTVRSAKDIDALAGPATGGIGDAPGLSDSPVDVFTTMMSVPHRLTVPYIKALTEWTDPEIQLVEGRLADASLEVGDLKRVLAGEVVAALHGVSEAMAARRAHAARAMRLSPGGEDILPVVDVAEHAARLIGSVLTEVLAFTPNLSASRRLARQNGLRIIVEHGGTAMPVTLRQDAIGRALGDVVGEAVTLGTAGVGDRLVYLKAGRKLALLTGI